MISSSPYARVPWSIVLVAVLIPLIGIINLNSAAQATRPDLWIVQACWVTAAMVMVMFLARIRTRNLELVAYIFYIVVNVLLLLVLLVGTTKKGSQRWLNLGFFMLQPSELAKVSILVVTARYFSKYQVEGGYTLRDLLRPGNLTRPVGAIAGAFYMFGKMSTKAAEARASGLGEIPFEAPWWLQAMIYLAIVGWAAYSIAVGTREGFTAQRIIAPIDIILIPWALILVEPDLGTSLIVLAIAGAQILFCGVKRQSLIIAAVAGAITVVFGWSFLLKPYQKARVETFLNPENDLQGAGYHSSQSMIAIGSGQFLGKGPGEGTQTQLSFLPENCTDFVFSVLAEEWGFVGATTLILLFLALIVMIIQKARTYHERFRALLNIGAAAMLFCHVVINIGMVTGLLPVVGVPLSFVSYGGSAMVTQMLAVGIAVNTHVWRRT